MYIIFDIIILGFIIISGFIGYKKGLSEIVINIVGLLIALILAFMLKGTLARFIDEKINISSALKETITDGINAAMQDKVKGDEQTTQPTQEQIDTQENKPNFYTSLVEKMKITDGIDSVADKVVKFILETACFIIIFMVVSLIIFIVKMMLNLVFKLPILSSINKFGGLAAGTIISIVQVWVTLAILSFLSPMLTGITDMINSTYITRALYNTNIIVSILSSGLKF